jgi:hypothetical protein
LIPAISNRQPYISFAHENFCERSLSNAENGKIDSDHHQHRSESLLRPARQLMRWQQQSSWEFYKNERVCRVYCGERAREDALSYAQQRAGYAPIEIQVLDSEWNLVEAISRRTVRGLI